MIADTSKLSIRLHEDDRSNLEWTLKFPAAPKNVSRALEAAWNTRSRCQYVLYCMENWKRLSTPDDGFLQPWRLKRFRDSVAATLQPDKIAKYNGNGVQYSEAACMEMGAASPESARTDLKYAIVDSG